MRDLLIGLRLAFRARFLWVSLCGLLLLIFAAILSAQFSGRQSATIALDVGISIIRLTLPIVSILLQQELLSKEFDLKQYLTSLTYPRSRHQLLLGRVAAIALLTLGLLILYAAVLAGLTGYVSHAYPQDTPPDVGLPYIITIAFSALDLLVVFAIGTVIAVTATTPSFVFIGTLGFTLVARSYSSIVALLTRDGTLVRNTDTYQSSLSLLGYLLPDLAPLDVRMISLYGQWQFLPDDWPLRVVSTLAYAAALFALSVWALNRKKFV